MGTVIAIVISMVTCAGVDFVWKGKIGQEKGQVVDLQRSYDFEDSEYDYYVSISWSGGVSSSSVTRRVWNGLNEGQSCTVHFVTGGFTGLTWVYDVDYHLGEENATRC
jgi:hypothetical protein